MQGYKTIVTAVFSSVVSPFLVSKLGVTLSPEEQLYITSSLMGAIMAGMRFLTTTPVFNKKPFELPEAERQRVAILAYQLVINKLRNKQ